MLDFITKSIAKAFGTKSERDVKKVVPTVQLIKAEFAKLAKISDDELRGMSAQLMKQIQTELADFDAKIADLKAQIDSNPDLTNVAKDAIFKQIDKLEDDRNKALEVVLNKILPVAFAIVKETARRLTENKKLVVKATMHDEFILKRNQRESRFGMEINEDGNAVWHNKWSASGAEVEWNMVHYDVQLIGGIVLHEGKIAEMGTGEGKTLVATLPAFLNALAKRGVHIVTVNDYLAKRDSEWMSPLFEFHGLVVDCIDKHQPNGEERRQAYQADITYGTNNEFGFDYLRDNMASHVSELVQRKHHYAMVDEVDSVLIDDARTPLIISGPVQGGEKQEYLQYKPRIEVIVKEQLALVQGFLLEAKQKLKEGKDSEAGLALFRAHRGLPKYKPLLKFLGENGMRQLMQKSENTYLQDNARNMPEADKPLFFTIEEKNNAINLTDKGIERLTKDHSETGFFVLPSIGEEIAKIEKDPIYDGKEEEKVAAVDKLVEEYNAKTSRIHTVNQLLKAYTLFEKDVEYVVMDNKIKIVDEQTGRILDGRRYSDGLHQSIEAKENVEIQDATQTYATITLQNYFRMYHKSAGMTGTAETEAGEFWEIYKLDVVVIPTNRPIQRKDQQDKVYRTIREKYNAVAQEIQVLVELNRPVLVGTTSIENSELLSRMLTMRKIPHQVLNAKQHAREAEIIANAGLPRTVTIATNMAGRGTDIKLTPESRKAGGLAIIGTERHESRRVDRQLRGRSGRQGDPGSSQFFVSMQDSLMRLFIPDSVAKIMDRMGLEEGEVIQHSMITRSIERAQKKVEENNFAIRKRLLEYDDVMNAQRSVIYKRRKNALFGERLSLDIANMFYATCEKIVEENKNNYSDFRSEVIRTLGTTTHIAEADIAKLPVKEAAQKLYGEMLTHYKLKNKQILAKVVPVVHEIHEKHGSEVEEIYIPFTDGKMRMVMNVNLQKAIATEGRSLIDSKEQMLTLNVIDNQWKEHLRDMDDLRQQVQMATVEQKDPLVIYKFEGYNLFKALMAEINMSVSSFLSKSHIEEQSEEEIQARQIEMERLQREQELERRKIIDQMRINREMEEAMEKMDNEQKLREIQKVMPRVAETSINRNDKVSVRYKDGTVKKNVKYKVVEQDIENNLCVVID